MTTVSSNAPTITVRVRLSQTPNVTSHVFTGQARIQTDFSSRYANAGEVIVRLQDRGGITAGGWRTIEQANTETGGNYQISRSPRLDPGRYRITAQHKASGAEYGVELEVNSNFGVSYTTGIGVVHEGSEMESTFRQGRPHGGLAITESRFEPRIGNTPGSAVRVRQLRGAPSPLQRLPRV